MKHMKKGWPNFLNYTCKTTHRNISEMFMLSFRLRVTMVLLCDAGRLYVTWAATRFET